MLDSSLTWPDFHMRLASQYQVMHVLIPVCMLVYLMKVNVAIVHGVEQCNYI